MSMATITKLKNANFSGQGLPNINPFVALSDAEFAFDFRNRSNRLADLAGKHTLTAYRQDIAGGQTRVVDPTIVFDANGGLGITVQLGYLQIDMPVWTIPIDGSRQFSILVVGGYSGIPFPAGKIAGATPVAASLLDCGTGVGSKGLSLEVNTQLHRTGARVKSGALNLFNDQSPDSRTTFRILTFDGTTWTLDNRTLGTIITKTNADLGITGTITPDTAHVANVVMGQFHSTSTLNGLYPQLNQLVVWNRVMTQAEKDDQYARSKAVLSSLGI